MSCSEGPWAAIPGFLFFPNAYISALASKVRHGRGSRQTGRCSPKRVTLPPSDRQPLSPEVLWIRRYPSATLQSRKRLDAKLRGSRSRPIVQVLQKLAPLPVCADALPGDRDLADDAPRSIRYSFRAVVGPVVCAARAAGTAPGVNAGHGPPPSAAAAPPAVRSAADRWATGSFPSRKSCRSVPGRRFPPRQPSQIRSCSKY